MWLQGFGLSYREIGRRYTRRQRGVDTDCERQLMRAKRALESSSRPDRARLTASASRAAPLASPALGLAQLARLRGGLGPGALALGEADAAPALTGARRRASCQM